MRGRGRDNYRDQHQRRSPTPPGTVPIEERKRVGSQWDMVPEGFEGLGALQAKLTGKCFFFNVCTFPKALVVWCGKDDFLTICLLVCSCCSSLISLGGD